MASYKHKKGESPIVYQLSLRMGTLLSTYDIQRMSFKKYLLSVLYSQDIRLEDAKEGYRDK